MQTLISKLKSSLQILNLKIYNNVYAKNAKEAQFKTKIPTAH